MAAPSSRTSTVTDPDPTTEPPDSGTAVIEFIFASVVLLIPVIYLMLTLSQMQAASYATTSAAISASRIAARDANPSEARAEAVGRSHSPAFGSAGPRPWTPTPAADPWGPPGPPAPHRAEPACPRPAPPPTSAPIMPHTSLCGPATPMSSPQEPDEMAEEPAHESDAGSITPLAIGFVVIALLLAFLIAALTDLLMARPQLQGLVDSAALAASDA